MIFTLFIMDLDVKGQNPKAQPFRILAQGNFWKINNFGNNHKKIEKSDFSYKKGLPNLNRGTWDVLFFL